MTSRSDWEGRTGNKWAQEWRRTDRSFAGLTERLLGRARTERISAALDVGCGAGELTLALARGNPDAQIVGIDISVPLVEAARERGEHLANASFEVADASHWSRPGFHPDLVVSRHGVMFFDQPVGAFAHLAQLVAPRGGLLFSCFRARAENPWATEIAELLPPGTLQHPAPGAPGPFAFADPNEVESILTAAGWSDIAFEAVDFAYIAGMGEDPAADATEFFLSIGPAAAAATELPSDERAAFIERLERWLHSRREGNLVGFPAAAWIVTGRRG
ncbi:class I SAM-dependent methyltransferase [Tsuneonella sp. HG249]